MYRLVLAKLASQGVILPGKIHERMLRLAEFVNGGLGPENLDPTYKIPATAIAEPKQTLILAAPMDQFYASGATQWRALMPPLPAAATLLRVELVIGSTDTSPAYSPALQYGDPASPAYFSDVTLGTDVPWKEAFPVASGQIRRAFSWLINSADAALAKGAQVFPVLQVGASLEGSGLAVAHLSIDPEA
ncbi:MAG: hypothetical protein ACM3UX_00590 [Candidatus Woesearchaeota archaeon]